MAAAVRTDSAVLLALASLLPRAQLAAALLPSAVWRRCRAERKAGELPCLPCSKPRRLASSLYHELLVAGVFSECQMSAYTTSFNMDEDPSMGKGPQYA